MKSNTRIVPIMSLVMLMGGMAETAQADEGADSSLSMEERMQRLEYRYAIGSLLVTY